MLIAKKDEMTTFFMPISHVTYIHAVGVMFFASNLSSLWKNFKSTCDNELVLMFWPKKRKGGGPGKIELDLKKKKLQIHPAELQSRGWRH